MQRQPLTKDHQPQSSRMWTWINPFKRQKRSDATPPSPMKPFKGSVDHLLDEENLYQTWRVSLRTGTDKINKGVPFFLGAAVLLLLVLTKPSNGILVSQWGNWLGIMSGFMVTMLGFVVSGFAIFSSMNRPSMFAVMAKLTDPSAPQVSYLKGLFLRLLRVFAEYWFIMAGILLLQMLTTRDAPLFVIVDLIQSSQTKNWLLIAVCSASVWIFIYSLMLLQSFIFNIYQFVMMCVVCDITDMEIENAPQENTLKKEV